MFAHQSGPAHGQETGNLKLAVKRFSRVAGILEIWADLLAPN